MEIKDGRGEFKKEIGRQNREIVKAFFEENPSATIADCIRATGFVFQTVKNHVDAIRNEQNYIQETL